MQELSTNEDTVMLMEMKNSDELAIQGSGFKFYVINLCYSQNTKEWAIQAQ
jgi:hypothetical protein